MSTPPWRQHSYIGEFTTDALATAEVVSRGWDVAGVPPDGLRYFNTLTLVTKFSLNGAWVKVNYGPGVDHQPPLERFVAYATAEWRNSQWLNHQRHICVDSRGYRYFLYVPASFDPPLIVAISPDYQRHVYEVPFTFTDDFTLQINSSDELVIVYADGTGLIWISKCLNTDLGLQAVGVNGWSTAQRVDSGTLTFPAGISSAIDSIDRIWISYQEQGFFPSPLYYAVWDTTTTPPSSIQAETNVAGLVSPDTGTQSLEIDSGDNCHIVISDGNQIVHFYISAPAGPPTAPVVIDSTISDWVQTTMVITSSDRIVVAYIDQSFSQGGIVGSWIDPPWTVSGSDPGVLLETDTRIFLSSLSYGNFMLSINDVGDIIFCEVVALSDDPIAPSSQVAIMRTDDSFTPTDPHPSGPFRYRQTYEIAGLSVQLNVHWANYNHNRPGYDYPLLISDFRKHSFTAGLTNQDTVNHWIQLGG